MSPAFVIRLVGASQLVLGVAHLLIWRLLGWTGEMAKLTPLSGRVFAVHTFFIAFVISALGALALICPELLLVRSELARLLLGAGFVFWSLRLVAQPLVFDPVLLRDSPYRLPVRAAALLGFAGHAAVYGWAFARQLG